MARSALGLRPRLLAALLATSAVTLAAAALTLLPPLRNRLRAESVRNVTATAVSARASFERALRDGNCDGVAFSLQRRASAQVAVVDNGVPKIVCGGFIEDVAGALDVQTALNTGRTTRFVVGDEVKLTVPLARARGGAPQFALVVRKPLRDVAQAVDQVRNAFVKAAVVGLAASLVLGFALATTLLRRLEQLRRAVLRVTAEGPGAPPPRDESFDEVGDLARAFATMQSALGRQEEARRAFVATASHELRTPLTSLQGMLELLDEDLREGRLDLADAQQQVAAAQGELRRLGNLATELLDLSRLDADTPLRSEPVELGELCRAVASELGLRAQEAGVPLEVVPPIGPCWARGDPGAVARVLRILLDNALRFSPSGKPIRIAASYRGEHALLEVSDRGSGVPDAERTLIFERFQRGSQTGGEGGFGLGLAIGRELAERLGGTLRLEDDAGPGARFVFELPIELPTGGRQDDEL